MSEFFRRHTVGIVGASLLLLSLFLMSASLRHRELASGGASILSAVLSPFERLYEGGLKGVRGVWSRYLYLIAVEDERRDLANRLKALEAQNSQYVELKTENDRLRTLLNYQETKKVKGITATVTSRDASNWAESISVDRGESDGIKVGQAVVDGNAVVGQVIATSGSSAKIQLLTDNVSSIDALVQTSRAQGTIEGSLQPLVNLKYVSRESVVNIGDRVIASGLDGVYPKGALVGVVIRVERDSSGMFQSIDIEPSADVRRLETVLILSEVGKDGVE